MSKPAEIFKALSDPTRLRCLLLLHGERELCVCELVEALNVSQPLISRHLAHLRGVGIVEDERRGQWVHYRLSPGLGSWVIELLEILQRVEAETDEMIEARARLSAMLPRPPGRCDE